MKIAEELGIQIRTIRSEKNMTQEALAHECNLAVTKISKLELGKSNPTLMTLDKVAKGLGVHVSDLFSNSSIVTVEFSAAEGSLYQAFSKVPYSIRPQFINIMDNVINNLLEVAGGDC